MIRELFCSFNTTAPAIHCTRELSKGGIDFCIYQLSSERKE